MKHDLHVYIFLRFNYVKHPCRKRLNGSPDNWSSKVPMSLPQVFPYKNAAGNPNPGAPHENSRSSSVGNKTFLPDITSKTNL